MGPNTVRLIVLLCAVAMVAVTATPAVAASPIEIQATTAQSGTIPYSFEAYEIGETGYQLIPDFDSPAFINPVGSAFLTVFSILERLNFVPKFVVLVIGLQAVWWLAYLVVQGRKSNNTASKDVESEQVVEDGQVVAEDPPTGDGNPYRYPRRTRSA